MPKLVKYPEGSNPCTRCIYNTVRYNWEPCYSCRHGLEQADNPKAPDKFEARATHSTAYKAH